MLYLEVGARSSEGCLVVERAGAISNRVIVGTGTVENERPNERSERIVIAGDCSAIVRVKPPKGDAWVDRSVIVGAACLAG